MASAVVATLAVGAPSLNEAFNIAQAEVVTVHDYLDEVKAALEASGCPAIADAAQVAAGLQELGAEVCNYENQSAIDITKAQRVLGWEPTSFAEFIKATTDWHTPLLLGTGTSEKL